MRTTGIYVHSWNIRASEVPSALYVGCQQYRVLIYCLVTWAVDRIYQHPPLPSHNGHREDCDSARVGPAFRPAWHQASILVDVPDCHVGKHIVLYLGYHCIHRIVLSAREDMGPDPTWDMFEHQGLLRQ